MFYLHGPKLRLLNSFHFNGHTLGFHPKTGGLKPPYTLDKHYVLVINKVSILAILVKNRVWYFYSHFELSMYLKRSHFLIIIDRTINKCHPQIIFRATVAVPAKTVINRVLNV